MTTIDNYPEKANSIDFSSLPSALQKGNDYVKKVTLNFTSRTAYDTSADIKRTVDMYFSKLDKFLATTTKPVVTTELREENPKKETAPKKEKASKKHTPASAKKERGKASHDENIEWVERIPEELRFMKRYINLNGKTKTYEQLLSFINSLQRAILEKRIRKSSPYAKQVDYMQKKLLSTYNAREGESVQVKIAPATVKEFSALFNKEKVFKSVQFIKRFISLHGKTGVKEKAKKLYDSLNRAVKKGVLQKSDKYAAKLNEIWKMLGDFIKDENQTRLALDKEELNGLMGLCGCGCEKHGSLNGLERMETVKAPERPEYSIAPVSSMDFMHMKFPTIGLKGKWHDFMGDPAPGFTAMVFGRPKTGKSCLCVEFAGYLARNHGKVLYVAREEGLDATLQMKLNDRQVEHPNLYICDDLPHDLSNYDFVFLDSVTKLGLSPKDLDALRKENPGKCFIFVFQVTKDGHFRGRNEFQHDVDIVIEVPEKGKAVQYGRYNQGGELNIF